MATDKRHLLDATGYVYSFNRMMYFNRGAKKAFSIEFVQDHDTQELGKLIREEKSDNGWKFYCNFEPSPSVKRELERALN